jgi:predicted phage terminase large subunit-like protein
MQRQQQINDHKRIASFSKLLKENPKDIRLAEALLSACANATAKDDGSYETKTAEAEYAFKKGMEVYNACLFNAANARDIDNKRKWLVLTKSSLLFLAHKYFDSFMLYLEFDRRPDKRFYAPRKSQLKPIVEGFQDVADGKVDLLTVSQPKRTGKTTLGLLFVIWRAGMQPDKSCFLVGRGDSLAKSFYDGCLTFLQDKAEYNYWDVFPGHALSATNAEQRTIDLDSRHRFPTIMCNSIDSQITGRTEASNLLYCDDLVIGADDARNKDRLDNLWDKVRSDCLGRRKEHVPIIAQGTRFSIYDPIGHLIDIAPEMGWRTKVIEVPALDYKTDESNFYYKYGMGFSTEYYRNERKLVTDLQWESEFQQRPIEEKGVVFGKSDLQYYDKLPENVDWDAILAVIDPSEGKGDFTSMVVAFVSGVDVYIEDVVYSQALPEVNAPKCGIMCVKHGVKVCQVESNANGLLFAEKVENQINGMGGRTSVRTKRTTANKQTKIILASDNIRNHFWFKNPNYLSNASEYAHFLRDTWSYSQVSRNQHDDSVDSLAMMENMIANLTTGKVQAFKRPF